MKELHMPPDEDIKPKDAENIQRIDNKAHQDIAKDIGTDKIKIISNPESTSTSNQKTLE